MTKHEYAFDIKISAVIRLNAHNEEEAECLLSEALAYAQLKIESGDVQLDTAITDTSMCVDDALGPLLIEIDGKDAD